MHGEFMHREGIARSLNAARPILRYIQFKVDFNSGVICVFFVELLTIPDFCLPYY